jgi:hypothetical protein
MVLPKDASVVSLNESATKVLNELAPSMSADGVQLVLDKVADNAITVRVELAEDVCSECVLPAKLIGEIVLNRIQRLHLCTAVSIEDSRLSEGARPGTITVVSASRQ